MVYTTNQTKVYLHQITGHPFSNDQHAIAAIDARTKQAHQRLAILGDSNLKAVIVEDAYESGSTPGHIGTLLEKIGSNPNLSRVGRQMDIADHIIMNPGHCGPISDKIVATTVEALLGSIYLDSGKDLEAVRGAMTSMGLTADARPTSKDVT